MPARSAALARFAALLTAQPWSTTTQLAVELAAQGLGAEAVEAATGVVAMFNYPTRVADSSAIEFDDDSPLPTFQGGRRGDPVTAGGPRNWMRDAGYSEPALLHAISTVALQNAESRLAMGRGLTTR